MREIKVVRVTDNCSQNDYKWGGEHFFVHVIVDMSERRCNFVVGVASRHADYAEKANTNLANNTNRFNGNEKSVWSV